MIVVEIRQKMCLFGFFIFLAKHLAFFVFKIFKSFFNLDNQHKFIKITLTLIYTILHILFEFYDKNIHHSYLRS